jgi:antirestriction protein
MATATITTTATETPRVYVACLAAYNSGILHGAWIDAAQEPWVIYDDVQAMLAASPIDGAEEWAIHDYEGFGGATIEEYTGFEQVSELAGFIAEHGALGAAVLGHFCGDLDEAREAIADRYHGCHESLADYMQELTEDTTTTIPESLRHYIDYESMARDAEMSGDFFTISTAWNEVHVFAGC